MGQNRKILSLLICCIFSIAYMHGQQSVTTTGGTATGSGGSVTYTVGQVAYQTFTGSSGSVAQGVQQPCDVFPESDS